MRRGHAWLRCGAREDKIISASQIAAHECSTTTHVKVAAEEKGDAGCKMDHKDMCGSVLQFCSVDTSSSQRRVRPWELTSAAELPGSRAPAPQFITSLLPTVNTASNTTAWARYLRLLLLGSSSRPPSEESSRSPFLIMCASLCVGRQMGAADCCIVVRKRSRKKDSCDSRARLRAVRLSFSVCRRIWVCWSSSKRALLLCSRTFFLMRDRDAASALRRRLSSPDDDGELSPNTRCSGETTTPE
mmetsp:Transcript_11377/g.16272  ORF Transcript_11377/g.16272 Transcript_11377/m.16272 type:complete len:244 (-) Transcript_11377:256-987(-)